MNIRTKIRRHFRPHIHDYYWTTESLPFGRWVVFAKCEGKDACGNIGWLREVHSTRELNMELERAYSRGELTALGYFSAPTSVPGDIELNAGDRLDI